MLTLITTLKIPTNPPLVESKVEMLFNLHKEEDVFWNESPLWKISYFYVEKGWYASWIESYAMLVGQSKMWQESGKKKGILYQHDHINKAKQYYYPDVSQQPKQINGRTFHAASSKPSVVPVKLYEHYTKNPASLHRMTKRWPMARYSISSNGPIRKRKQQWN